MGDFRFLGGGRVISMSGLWLLVVGTPVAIHVAVVAESVGAVVFRSVDSWNAATDGCGFMVLFSAADSLAMDDVGRGAGPG